MTACRLAAVFVVGSAMWAAPVAAEAGNGWRPCGPGNPFGCFNKLVPQGAFGADFRPACARHDACYSSGCDRDECDRQFYRDTCQACQCSRCPLLCRCRAKCMYCMVRLFNCGHKGGCCNKGCGQSDCCEPACAAPACSAPVGCGSH